MDYAVRVFSPWYMTVEYVLIGLGIFFVISLIFKNNFRSFWGIDEALQKMEVIVWKLEALEKTMEGRTINTSITGDEAKQRELNPVQVDKTTIIHVEPQDEVSALSMSGFRIADWGTPIERIKTDLQLSISYKTTEPLIDKYMDPNDILEWNGIELESIRYGFLDGLYQWSELTLKPHKVIEMISKLTSMYGNSKMTKDRVDYWQGKTSVIAYKHIEDKATSSANLLIINREAFIKDEAHLLERVLSI